MIWLLYLLSSAALRLEARNPTPKSIGCWDSLRAVVLMLLESTIDLPAGCTLLECGYAGVQPVFATLILQPGTGPDELTQATNIESSAWKYLPIIFISSMDDEAEHANGTHIKGRLKRIEFRIGGAILGYIPWIFDHSGIPPPYFKERNNTADPPLHIAYATPLFEYIMSRVCKPRDSL